MTTQEEAIQRILKRERLARKQAEEVIEKKSLELYRLNERLLKTNEQLEIRIIERTSELRDKNYQLKQSTERINLAIESAGLGVWDWDITSSELFYSEGFERFGGYSKEEFKERFSSFFEMIHPNDREAAQKAMVLHLKGLKEDFKQEVRLLKKDAGYIWLSVAGKVMERDRTGKAMRVIGVFQDISNRKEIEHELINAKEKAENASQAKADFLSTMSLGLH